MPVDLMVPEPQKDNFTTSQYVQDNQERFREAYDIAREATGRSARRYKEYYDAKGYVKPYGVGDKLWLYVPFPKRDMSLRLSLPWQGPYIVIKIMDI